MASFSERLGVVELPTALQLEAVTDALRNSVWNLLYDLYEEDTTEYWKMVAKHVAQYFRKTPADDLPYPNYDCRKWLKEYFYSLSWYRLYDMIEFVADNHRCMTRRPKGYGPDYFYHRFDNEKVKLALNRILERELSGYRFVAGVLSPISDRVEVEEIAEAVAATQRAGLIGAAEHIRTAVVLLGKKPEPDYRNSIKEAISAVESAAKQIGREKSGGIDGALESLAKKSQLHGALKAGFKSLYGFTSDADGIRHAILDEPNVGFAEAKYMIVACSAFVNYLIQKADESGMLQ